MKLLYMTDPGNVDPWHRDFVASLGDEWEVVMWSAERPFAAQVEGALAVVDVGARLEPGMVRQAGEAGVKLWQLIFTGYDQLDLGLFRANGIPVANTPGQFSARALAELALMLMLCTVRGFTRAQRDLHVGLVSHSFGGELAGRTLGLIGLGASGRELAKLTMPLGLDVIGINPAGSSANQAADLGVDVLGGPDKLDELLGRSDVMSIHVPLTPATRQMIGADALSKMKPDSILINVARGQIVDQPALVDALRAGRIAGAGLDVFAVEPLPADDPLLSLDNVVLTPHVAGATYETSRRRGVAAAENVRRVARGEAPLYV
ncbi:MAG: NAD(P)-dependent oxidoreductase, partial [Acidimicrobiales bacterium]